MLTLVTNVSLSYMLGKGSESSSLSFFKQHITLSFERVELADTIWKTPIPMSLPLFYREHILKH